MLCIELGVVGYIANKQQREQTENGYHSDD